MNTIKTLSAALVVTTLLCLHVYASYRNVIESTGKRYILELESGRVWEIDEKLSKLAFATALDSLLPWGDSLIFTTNRDAQLLGRVMPIDGPSSCKLLPEQTACVERSPVTDAESDVILDYEKYAWPDLATPLTQTINAVRKKAPENPDDLPSVFSVRAAVIHRPGNNTSRWTMEELGPTIAFRGKGAANFSRLVGITIPGIGELYER